MLPPYHRNSGGGVNNRTHFRRLPCGSSLAADSFCLADASAGGEIDRRWWSVVVRRQIILRASTTPAQRRRAAARAWRVLFVGLHLAPLFVVATEFFFCLGPCLDCQLLSRISVYSLGALVCFTACLIGQLRRSGRQVRSGRALSQCIEIREHGVW